MKHFFVLIALCACEGSAVETTTAAGPDAQTGTEPDLTAVEWRAVSGDELESLLGAVQILDTRSRTAYEARHLPGALHIDGNDFRRTVDGIDGQAILEDEAFELLEQAGVEPDQPVAVYGSGNDTTTSRALWSLAFFGATDSLLLLDGGMDNWEGQKRPVAQSIPSTQATDWQDSVTLDGLRVDQAWVMEHLDNQDVLLVDVRSFGEYSSGHIPGAINVEWTMNLENDGSFRRDDDVLSLHGNPDADTVVVYCQSGARASVSWALLTFAGLADVRLYDGSWNEWGADPDTPKTTGPHP